ncbi:MAG: S-methyl-5-thioribose-1-phosphate isomerase [Deltaproteobacteria bacterium]|nr:S-methyl-5-thioribose-1-phosphate isomerase [Deltaproteobacteria bacterium]
MFKTIVWEEDKVVLLDQTKLPLEETYLVCDDYHAVAEAIKKMVVRGAPAIGVAAAMGIAQGALSTDAGSPDEFRKQVEKICQEFAQTRPTAINLFWAIERMKNLMAAHNNKSVEELKALLKKEALSIGEEDIKINRQIGRRGKALIKDGDTVLTHCNAGALATAGYGTALGVIRAACEEGKKVEVLACETRPFLQGARLTSWELQKSGILTTVITDNMAGYAMQKGKINLIITGADCVCLNGDVANKIGTYALAVLAREHGIPFYVAAPLSTINLDFESGEAVSIEERDEREVTHMGDKRIVPERIQVWNPAFDITPAKYISAIITEKGVAESPYKSNLKKLTLSVT